MTNGDPSEEPSTKSRNAQEAGNITIALFWLLGVSLGGLVGVTLVLLSFPVPVEPPARQPSDRPARGSSPTTEPTSITRATSSKRTTTPWTEETPEIAPDNPVCYTSGCINVAKALKNQLNRLVAPCDNFREYVCGRYRGSTGTFLGDQSDELLTDQVMQVRRPQTPALPPQDARQKAARLFQECVYRFVSTSKAHRALETFFRKEKLNVAGIPKGMGTQPSDLLALQVHLAFDYMLGTPLLIKPGMPGRLTVSLDYAWNELYVAYRGLGSERLPDYVKSLAKVQDVELSEDATRAIGITLAKAFAAMSSLFAGGTDYQQSPIMRETTVRAIRFTNVEQSAFASAVESKTPYTRFSSVDLHPMLEPVVSALYNALTPHELYEWTSWSVLEQCGRYVDTDLTTTSGGEGRFRRRCMRLVKHVMPEPIAAITLMNAVDNYRPLVTTMATAVGQYLAANASRWVRPASMNVVVGFPTDRDTVEELNAYYADLRPPKPDNFFEDWVKAARTRRLLMNSTDMHFDPSGNDVGVSEDGTVIIPAGVFGMPFDMVGSVPAVNLGGLGHMISMRLIQRLRVVTSGSPAECNAHGTSEATAVFENLLAFESARHVMDGMVARNQSSALWLPMLLDLSSARQFFTVGCFKDCRRRGTGIHGSCDGDSLRRLPSFGNAFGCQPTGPTCTIP